MFKRASLLCIAFSFLSTTTQACSQKESPPDARHDLKLIVSGGNAAERPIGFSDTCPAVQFYYNSIVALTPNGKLLFTVARSGGSAGKAVEDATTVAIRKIYSQSTLLQKQSPFNSGAPQETVKPIEPTAQEPPAEP